jgi:hypothetical protein
MKKQLFALILFLSVAPAALAATPCEPEIRRAAAEANDEDIIVEISRTDLTQFSLVYHQAGDEKPTLETAVATVDPASCQVLQMQGL